MKLMASSFPPCRPMSRCYSCRGRRVLSRTVRDWKHLRLSLKNLRLSSLTDRSGKTQVSGPWPARHTEWPPEALVRRRGNPTAHCQRRCQFRQAVASHVRSVPSSCRSISLRKTVSLKRGHDGNLLRPQPPERSLDGDSLSLEPGPYFSRLTTICGVMPPSVTLPESNSAHFNI